MERRVVMSPKELVTQAEKLFACSTHTHTEELKEISKKLEKIYKNFKGDELHKRKMVFHYVNLLVITAEYSDKSDTYNYFQGLKTIIEIRDNSFLKIVEEL
jgi:hypothetical protein